MNTGIILQARMGSTRLPGKVLKPLAGKPLLGYIIARLQQATEIPLIVATSDLPADDAIERFCHANNVTVFRGSEADVLSRFYHCATQHEFSHIIRLTGDNPFVDVEELERLNRFHVEGSYDYSHAVAGLPMGVGAEIFTYDALKKSFNEATDAEDLEHVNEYILKHPDQFNIGTPTIAAAKHVPNLRLTVDTAEDYERAVSIAQAVPITATTEEIIALCSASA